MNFLFMYFHLITLVVWTLFFIFVLVRVFYPRVLKYFSYKYFIVIAVSLHLVYGAVATWLTYLKWGAPLQGGEINVVGQFFLTTPLSKEAPLPISGLEWMRPLFEGTHGYFAGYSFFHYFLSAIALFIITAFFVLFFKFYNREHPGSFKDGEISIITLAFLIVGINIVGLPVAGWASALVLVFASFIIATLWVLVKMAFKKTNYINVSKVFIIMVPIVFVFAVPFLSLVSFWPLLKL